MGDISIQTPELAHVEPISHLMKQLGYTIDLKDLTSNLTSILLSDNHEILVASYESTIIGVIHGFYTLTITNTPRFEISSFIIHQDHRGKGLGSIMLEKMVSNKANVQVRCNVLREEAHQFYLKHDYIETKQQKVFRKKL